MSVQCAFVVMYARGEKVAHETIECPREQHVDHTATAGKNRNTIKQREIGGTVTAKPVSVVRRRI